MPLPNLLWRSNVPDMTGTRAVRMQLPATSRSLDHLFISQFRSVKSQEKMGCELKCCPSFFTIHWCGRREQCHATGARQFCFQFLRNVIDRAHSNNYWGIILLDVFGKVIAIVFSLLRNKFMGTRGNRTS